MTAERGRDEVLADLDELREFLDEVERLLPVAQALQWERSPVGQSPRGEKVSGSLGKSDPTAAAALDWRRLALRAEVQRTERWLLLASRAARALQGKPVPPMYRRKAA